METINYNIGAKIYTKCKTDISATVMANIKDNVWVNISIKIGFFVYNNINDTKSIIRRNINL